MKFLDAFYSLSFWIYTASMVALLSAVWGALVWSERHGKKLDEVRRAYWAWVLLAGLVTPALFFGQEVFAMIVALISLFACKEFARATGLYEDWLFTGLVYLCILAVNLVAVWPGYDVFMASPIYALAVLCLLPILRNRAEGMLQRVALSVMAFVYFGYFLAHLSLLAGMRAPQVYGYLLFVIYGAASSDVAGWLVGRRLGKHPIAARISPHATWESAAGSLVWACLWTVVFAWSITSLPWQAILVLPILLAVVGLVGDLVMRYTLRDLVLKAPVEGTDDVLYVAQGHLHRLIFVAPLFFRLVHWFDRAGESAVNNQ